MICPNCGKEIPDGSFFCGECGSEVKNVAEEVKAEESVVEAKKEETPVVAEPVKEEANEPEGTDANPSRRSLPDPRPEQSAGRTTPWCIGKKRQSIPIVSGIPLSQKPGTAGNGAASAGKRRGTVLPYHP